MLALDGLSSVIKFFIRCASAQNLKLAQIGECFLIVSLFVNRNARSVIGKNIAPVFSRLIASHPDLRRIGAQVRIKIAAQAKGLDLTSFDYHPIEIQMVMLVTFQYLLSRKTFTGLWHVCIVT